MTEMKNRTFRNSERKPSRVALPGFLDDAMGENDDRASGAPSDGDGDDDPDDEDAAAAAVEDWLDELDLDEVEVVDPVELRRIGLAQTGIELAEAELRDAVKAARTAGQSWAAIGRTLGISRQAAHERFGRNGQEPVSEVLFVQLRQTRSQARSSIDKILSRWLGSTSYEAWPREYSDCDVTFVARDRALTVFYEAKAGRGTKPRVPESLDDAALDLLDTISACRKRP